MARHFPLLETVAKDDGAAPAESEPSAAVPSTATVLDELFGAGGDDDDDVGDDVVDAVDPEDLDVGDLGEEAEDE